MPKRPPFSGATEALANKDDEEAHQKTSRHVDGHRRPRKHQHAAHNLRSSKGPVDEEPEAGPMAPPEAAKKRRYIEILEARGSPEL